MNCIVFCMCHLYGKEMIKAWLSDSTVGFFFFWLSSINWFVGVPVACIVDDACLHPCSFYIQSIPTEKPQCLSLPSWVGRLFLTD